MIEIILEYEGDRIIAYKVSGHAGFAAKGSDVYCAGISAVCQTALLGLLKHINPSPYYRIEDGFLDCRLPENLGEEDRRKAYFILSAMEAGLDSIEEDYQKYLKIVRRNHDV